jgi:hypothetical protein
VNFIAAYSFDGDINKAEFIVRAGQKGASKISHPSDDTTILALGWSGTDTQISQLATSFLQIDKGYELIDAWNGGLAEKATNIGQALGSTFNTIFADQMTRLINGDRFYYFWRLQPPGFRKVVTPSRQYTRGLEDMTNASIQRGRQG